MRRTTVLTFIVLVCLGGAPTASAQGCKFSNFTPLQHNTPLSIGPILLGILSNYPQLWTVLGAARDAWDGTNAGNHIGDPSGYPSASDCPVGLPLQIGAMDFSQGGWCGAIGSGGAAAVTDYLPTCPGCGTKSIIINTNVAWSFNPGPNDWDVQSVMAHEFGHMLGFTHQFYAQCNDLT